MAETSYEERWKEVLKVVENAGSKIEGLAALTENVAAKGRLKILVQFNETVLVELENLHGDLGLSEVDGE